MNYDDARHIRQDAAGSGAHRVSGPAGRPGRQDDQLSATGNAYRLIDHLGNRETTLVAGEHYLALAPTRSLSGVRYPDLLVAFGVDPEAYYRSKAYVISEQGKPPDLVLEVASESTGAIDAGAKREDYAGLGIVWAYRYTSGSTRRWSTTRRVGWRTGSMFR